MVNFLILKKLIQKDDKLLTVRDYVSFICQRFYAKSIKLKPQPDLYC